MITITRSHILECAICAAMTFSSASAWALPGQVLSHYFFQDGYAEGATVTGSFSGVDLDGNGLLVHFPASGVSPPVEYLELLSWSMHFSGNSHSPAFNLSLAHLYGFVYEIGTAGVGDGLAFEPTLNQNLIEGVGAIGADHFFATGLGPTAMVGGLVGGDIDLSQTGNLASHALDSSANLLLVTQVPEVASFGLMSAAAMVLVAIRRSLRVPIV
jgi:hypothetical protein